MESRTLMPSIAHGRRMKRGIIEGIRGFFPLTRIRFSFCFRLCFMVECSPTQHTFRRWHSAAHTNSTHYTGGLHNKSWGRWLCDRLLDHAPAFLLRRRRVLGALARARATLLVPTAVLSSSISIAFLFGAGFLPNSSAKSRRALLAGS